MEARIEPAVEGLAGLGEGALGDGVVLWEVAEGECVADFCMDLWGIEGELSVGADSDGNVGSEGEGN